MRTPGLLLSAGGVLHGHAAQTIFPAPLRSTEYEMRPLSAAEARQWAETWHYARGVGRLTHAYGLHVRACGSLVAVAAFNPPSLGAAKFMAQGVCTHQQVLGLSRLCFHPDAPKNAGSFLLSRAFACLPERWAVISTYADEAQGVVGVVYQASNLSYLGKTEPRAVWTKGGVQVSVQRGGKTLTREEMQQDGAVLSARACMHRYRLVRQDPERERRERPYPKPMTRLL